MDIAVNVTVNDKIRHWIRTVLTHDSLPEDIREDLRKYGGSRRNKDEKTRTIPYSLLKKVFLHMKNENGKLFIVFYNFYIIKVCFNCALFHLLYYNFFFQNRYSKYSN